MTRGSLALAWERRPGRPLYPGRGRLLQGPRPVLSGAAERRHARDLAAFGPLCLLCGVLLGWGLRTEDVNFERVRAELAEETGEVLLKHSDEQACALFRTGLAVRQAPGLEWIARNGEASADQIPAESWPEKLEWCREER